MMSFSPVLTTFLSHPWAFRGEGKSWEWTRTGIRPTVGHTVKPVLIGHSKIDKTKILKTCSSLMKFESIAECCNTF